MRKISLQKLLTTKQSIEGILLRTQTIERLQKTTLIYPKNVFIYKTLVILFVKRHDKIRHLFCTVEIVVKNHLE